MNLIPGKAETISRLPVLAYSSPEAVQTTGTVAVHPNQIYNWKKQLLDSASSVFEGGGTAAEGTASEAQVDILYRQIGQLKVENDFLARKLGK